MVDKNSLPTLIQQFICSPRPRWTRSLVKYIRICGRLRCIFPEMLLWLWNSISSEDAEILRELEMYLGSFLIHPKNGKVKWNMYKNCTWKQHYSNIRVEILFVQRSKEVPSQASHWKHYGVPHYFWSTWLF